MVSGTVQAPPLNALLNFRASQASQGSDPNFIQNFRKLLCHCILMSELLNGQAITSHSVLPEQIPKHFYPFNVLQPKCSFPFLRTAHGSCEVLTSSIRNTTGLETLSCALVATTRR